ncbi:hypothetical protein L9F63_015224, partial [Diploptera punctata]
LPSRILSLFTFFIHCTNQAGIVKTHNCMRNKMEFILTALKHMDAEKREIYQSSGEVVGLALKLIASHSSMSELDN